MRKPVVQAGCMDCGLITNHNTTSHAVTSLTAHVNEWPEHRPLIADNNGWHRLWLDPDVFLDYAPKEEP